MKSFPMILVREFNGQDTCFRIAAHRARNYWELLANLHNAFSKPWERYNAHLHFDGGACDDRMSPSEWDAGGYFDPEFVVDGRLVLYAHFEQVEPPPESGIDALGRFETEQEDNLWYQGTYGDQGLRTKRKFTEDIDDDLGETKQDLYPTFAEELPLNSLIAKPLAASTHTIKSALMLPFATNKVVTVDDSSSTRHLDTGVVIGRALPESCLDPNVRPVVRAIISKAGALVAYIPGKYSKRSTTKGDIQIAMTHVEYTPELQQPSSSEEKLRAIRTMIEQRMVPAKKDTTPDARLSTIGPALPIILKPIVPELPVTTIDDSQHQRLNEEGIIIGRAKEHCCRVPHQRPVVRAMLNTRSNVITFIPARYANHARVNVEVSIAMKDVDFSDEFAALPLRKIADAIRAKIKTKGKAKETPAVHGSSVRLGGKADIRGGLKPVKALQTTRNEDEAGYLSDITDVPKGGALH